MHAKRVRLLDFDLGSLTLLLFGTGAAVFLAVSGI
jgi:hypothetical protein